MKFQGIYWLAIQDIGGFTTLSEQLAKKGNKGTEELCTIITNFFRDAEKKILDYNGRIFKLAGDAYYAIFPANIEIQKIKILGDELLNLKTLKEHNLQTRFVAVPGFIEGDWFQISDNYQDLLINGKAVYDLNLLAEKTPAGKANVLSGFHQQTSCLPDFPHISYKKNYQPAHRPLYIMFLEIPQDFDLAYKITAIFCNQKEKIKLLKWIPFKSTFKALLIAGFSESTGREAEVCIDIFNRLKTAFKDYKLKMGISSGIIFAGEIKTKRFNEFAVLGDRVNVAARLCTIAPDNDIYLSEEIENMLRGKFNFIDVGTIKLKGKEEKIRIYKPQEKISDVFNHSLFPFKFVGREKELNQALKLLNKRQSLCFIGDAGLGKSRMLYELRKNFSQKDVIEVALSPVSPPLFLLKEIFKYFPEGEFPELKRYLDGSIQLPTIRVIELLWKLFKTKDNLTIFMEDLHWLDNASFMLLKELVPLPFLILTSSRPDGEQFIDILKIQKFYLKNLSSNDLINLFEDIFGMPPDKKFFCFLMERTQGNPFYFEQILKDMQEKKFIIKKEHSFSIAEDARTLPFSIHSILLSRFDDLPIDIKKATEIAACIGRQFSLETINEIMPDRNINPEPACERGILLKTGEIYQFKHALFQDAILDSLLDARRKMHEKKIGEVFIKEGRASYEIAHHLTAGDEPYKALPYWCDTFEEFYGRGFHNEISKIIQRLTSDENEHFKEVGRLINALYLVKMADYYDAEKILKKLQRNKKLKKHVLFGLVSLYDWSSQHNKMKIVLEHLKKFPMTMGEKLIFLESCGIYYDMTEQNKIGLEYYKQALRLAKNNNARNSIAVSLYNIGWIYFKEKNYQKAEDDFRRSLNFTDEGDLFSEGNCLLRLGQIEMLKGNFEIALNYLKRSLRNYQTLDFAYWTRLALNALTDLYIILGKKQKAFLFAQRGDEVATMANLYANSVYMFHLYYGNLNEFIKGIKGKEKEYPKEFFLYLLAKNKKDEAIVFLKKHNLMSIIPSKKALKQRTFPLTFLEIYKKYA